MRITIRRARPEEADQLTEIACAAKAHWGYHPDQLAFWREAFLSVTPAYIAEHSVWAAQSRAGQAVAFAAIEQRGTAAILEHLWVTPAYMGMGIGQRLFRHAARHSPAFSFTSDPNADGFYIKMGAVKIGAVASAYQGRQLSLFRYGGEG